MGMSMVAKGDRISEVLTYLPISGREGGDYHGQTTGHWIIDSVIANPMSVYAEYRAQRRSWGVDALGGLIVELRTEGGLSGIGISQGGTAGCAIVERHLSRFVLGADPRDVERLWDQMWRATMPY